MTKREFDILYRQLAPQAFRRTFYMLGDEEAARDVVQTAFLSLWEQRAPVENPGAYVSASIRNQIASRYRSVGRHERFQRLYPIEMEGDVAESRPVDEIHEFVDNELTDAVRRVVKSVFYERKSYQETARDLGISVATVNKHIVTALRKLRDRFRAYLTRNVNAAAKAMVTSSPILFLLIQHF